ncbi:MAG: hypothetical protein PSV24_05770 [Rhodoferax sp.]|nr:hypothetical protein [Rhodoferax sp.]
MNTFVQNLKFGHQFALISVLPALMNVPMLIFGHRHLEHSATARHGVRGLAQLQHTMKLSHTQA